MHCRIKEITHFTCTTLRLLQVADMCVCFTIHSFIHSFIILWTGSYLSRRPIAFLNEKKIVLLSAKSTLLFEVHSSKYFNFLNLLLLQIFTNFFILYSGCSPLPHLLPVPPSLLLLPLCLSREQERSLP